MTHIVAVVVALALVGVGSPAPRRVARPVSGHSERLVARARRGDRLARERLVEEHMGLVRSIAGRYRTSGLPVEDLVQEGVVGLLEAAEDYDPHRGASFSTYAFWRIRRTISHAATSKAPLIRLPRPLRERRRRVAAARALLASYGREPTVGELVSATGLDRREVAEALSPMSVVSLDEPAVGDGVADAAPGVEAYVLDAYERSAVARAIAGLRGRKRAIVRRHFGLDNEPEPLAQIARDLDLSGARARALRDEALRDLAGTLASLRR